MTWLRGQTTYGSLISDLTALIAGEMADSLGTTASVGDRWVRPVAGVNYLQSSETVALGSMANRAGYWTLAMTASALRAGPSAPGQSQSVCRTTALASSTAYPRWNCVITVNTANTTAHDYSTLRFTLWAYTDDGQYVHQNGSLAPNAAGVYSHASIGTIAFSDPTGIIRVNTRWMRGYTTTYKGGIDTLGVHYPTRAALANPTFTVAPPGVSGTDWSFVDEAGTGSSVQSASGEHQIQGGLYHGLGIKTVAALTGDRYVFTYNAAGHGIRLTADPVNHGQLHLEWGGGIGDAATSYRRIGGIQRLAWLRTHQTPSLVTNSAIVQYWVSVRPGKLAIVLNADPGQSGKSTCNWIGKVTPHFPDLDKFPYFVTEPVRDYFSGSTVSPIGSSDITMRYTLLASKMKVDGSEGRDWQTGWARVDTGTEDTGQGIGNEYSSGLVPAVVYRAAAMAGDRYNSARDILPSRSRKPSVLDGKWWLYGAQYYDYYFIEGSGSTSTTAPYNGGYTSQYPRGTVSDGFLYIPDEGWSSGDELTDTATSKKYFLIAADYHGGVPRVRIGHPNVVLGGAAILEE